MNPYMTYPAEIKKIEKHTEIDYTFYIEKIVDVREGQFLQVSVPKYGEVPISISDYTDDLIELTIRKVGRVTDEIFNKKVGDNIYLRGPYGNHFNPEDYNGKDLIIISGGTGLAPVKGVVNYFARNSDRLKSFKLISGFKSSADILFKDSFDSWKDRLDVCLTIDREEEGWDGNVGFVTDYVRKLDYDTLEDIAVIMVGPPPMMKFTGMELTRLGIRDEQITVSFERKMSCAIGKCGHCKIDEVYVCLEGPIFTYDRAVKLID